MTALRELVAKLGFQVDDAGFKRANAGVENIKRNVTDVDRKLRDARGRFLKSGSATAAATDLTAGRFVDAVGRMREANGRFVKGASKGGEEVGGAASGVKRFQDASDSLQRSLTRLGATFGLTALLKQMTTLASDANETENVLREVFGQQGADDVKNWAAATGKEIGRSRYTLRDYTGQLGAMLEPMVHNADKAKEMSTRFAALSVDLASFFNTADDDALVALKAGLAGESEPLRRYGVVLLDATLQEFAHAQGIKKKVTAMNNAEKTELRYQFILANTKKAQGDAARTADGFANSSRALKDKLKDLATTAGQRLLPIAGKLIKWASDGIDKFTELGRTSNILEGSLIAVAAALVAMNAATLIEMLPAILSMLALAAAVDEVKTTLDGGGSLIRDWLEAWGGAGTTAKTIDLLTGALQALNSATAQSGWRKLYEASPNSALGQWALEQDMEVQRLSKPDRNERNERKHRYANPNVVSPRVRPMPLQYRADQEYSVLPFQDAITPSKQPRVAAPPLSLAAPASAAPASVTNINVTNGPINLQVAEPDAARRAARAAQVERRRTQDALRKGGH